MDRIFLKNSLCLYLLSFTKLIVPFLTLPYLTRVLSVDCYGTIAYVKSLMGYVQLIIDFGFLLSVTKAITELKKANDWYRISTIVITTTFTRIFLGTVSLFIICMLTAVIPILKNNLLYVILIFISVFITIFWMDFLFRGIEQMKILSFRFFVSKIIATILIFCLIKSDEDLVLMGVIEILGSLIAAGCSMIEIVKLKLQFIIPSFKQCLHILFDSLSYFMSNFSTTAFTLMVTFLVGLYLDSSNVAFWSLALQIVVGIQSFYTPILDALYPAMIREFRFALIKKVLNIVMPVIIIGCVFIYFFGGDIIKVIAGERYLVSAHILNYLIPLLIISFPAMLFGWPVLGALGMIKEVTWTLIVSSLLQIFLLIILIKIDKFNFYYIAVCRCLVEMFLLFSRVTCFYMNKRLNTNNLL